MAIKNTLLGGTNWASGDRLKALDLNDTFNAGVIHRKIHTSTTARTHTGNTNWTDTAETFTINHTANALLLGLYIQHGLTTSNASNEAYARLKIVGTTLGTKYAQNARFWTRTDDTASMSPMIGAEATLRPLFITNNTNLTPPHCASFSPLLLLPDTSTTFTVQISITDAGQTVTANNFEIIAVWLNAVNAT